MFTHVHASLICPLMILISETVNRIRKARYYSLPPADRVTWMRNLRGGGSVPPYYFEELDSEIQSSFSQGRILENVVKVVKSAVTHDNGICVQFDDGSTIIVSRIVLATGFEINGRKIPLLETVAKRFGLRFSPQGFPMLTPDLVWHDRISVVGALAAIELGPDALNITGARKGGAMAACRHGLKGTFHRKKKHVEDLFSLID